MFAFGLLHGLIYLNGTFVPGNLYVQDGKIAAVSGAELPCEQTQDAGGRMVLPGLIDPHVHFSLTVGAHTSSDDFYTGSVQAALGGVTTYIDFIDPVRSVGELHEAYRVRRALAERSALDYGLHCAVRGLEDAARPFLEETAALGMPTVKLFTTYSSSGRRTYDRDIAALLRESKRCGARIVAHAENDDLLYDGPDIPIAHHEQARPALCERTAVLNLCELAKACDGALYIVHASAGSTVRRVREQYAELLHGDVVLESCPQYFCFNADAYAGPDGYRYTMTPPLRAPEEEQLLRTEIDAIDVMGTDHCPFPDEWKRHPFTQEIPMGVGGIRYGFTAMYTLYGEKILPQYTENPARIEGLYPRKGTLLPGADADFVLFDPDAAWTVSDPESLYDGMQMRGKVCDVYQRGVPVVRDGAFVGHQGDGQYLERRISFT